MSAIQRLIHHGIRWDAAFGGTASVPPYELLYANRRNLSKRVRVVMDWLAEVVGDYLAAHHARFKQD